ncbi:MAG: acyl-CoA thioesterase [Burkholderiales bacterium]
MHPFDASLELEAIGSGADNTAVYRARTSDRYRNAIGPFGGWTAALLLRSVLHMPDARGAPLALDAVFMGPIDDGELETRVFLLRQNRTVGFWRSELWQRDRICAHAQVTLSSPRTGTTLQDARVPQVPPPDTVQTYVNPRTPVPWIEQYVFKPVTGMLFSGAESMDALLWLRDAEPRPLDAVSLTALCDTPFPSPWIRLADQFPVSTVAFSVYFRASAADYAAAGSDYALLESRAAVMENGYVDQFTNVWSAGGRLLAQTQQMLWAASTAGA